MYITVVNLFEITPRVAQMIYSMNILEEWKVRKTRQDPHFQKKRKIYIPCVKEVRQRLQKCDVRVEDVGNR